MTDEDAAGGPLMTKSYPSITGKLKNYYMCLVHLTYFKIDNNIPYGHVSHKN